MQEQKINAGVTLMNDFCRPGSNEFKDYIDYVDREEAQRNNAFSTFNLFNDYMGNPEKSSGLFTAEHDSLTYQEKKDLKAVFQMAQDNESMMWQTVISFDNRWLEKNGVYDADKKVLDERKIKEVTRTAINRLLKSEGLEHAVWSAGIHYNTDNIHVHIATVEPYPMREKMMYQGNLEVRGKFKLGNINKCKSTVVNEIMQTKEINLRINHIIRKDIVGYMKERKLTEDPDIKREFLELCESLPDLPANKMNYGNREMAQYRGRLDEISRLFLDRYCPEKYAEMIEVLERQSKMYEEAYGGGKLGYYKEDKIAELMKRMGNATLECARGYLKQIETKAQEARTVSELHSFRINEREIYEAEFFYGEPDNISEQEAGSATVDQPLDESLEIEWDLKLKPSQKEDMPGMEKDMEQGESHEIPIDDKLETGALKGKGKIYNNYYKEYKAQKDELKRILRKGDMDAAAQFPEKLNGSMDNPFTQSLIAEMYLNGQVVEPSAEIAEEYFRAALEQFERDVYMIPEVKKGFDIQKYILYRIGKQYDRGWGIEEDAEIAADWYRESGTSYANYSLGNLYFDGRGVEQDYQKAFEYYSSSGENPFAKVMCAKMYEKGLGVDRDAEQSRHYYEEAYKLFEELEEKESDSLFEYQLGNMRYYGKGCEQDTEKAVEYLREAVKQKNVPAILLLSTISIEEGLTEDMPQLIEALQELADKGENVNAQYILGKIYTADWEFYNLEKGIEYLEHAAEQGNEWAQYLLGKLYVNPELEIYNLEKGMGYLEESAEQGNEWAQYLLGKLYVNPELEIYNLEKGIGYLESSAEQGNEWAQYLLGKLYVNPELEIYDLEKGMGYLEESAEQGNEWAQYLLGKLYVNPELEIFDLQKGIDYLEKSMEQGNEPAKYVLACEYLNQMSAAYDPEKGMRYILELAEQGNEWAQFRAGVEYAKGENVKRDFSKAAEWLRKASAQGNEPAQMFYNDMIAKASSVSGSTNGRSPLNELDKAMVELQRSFYQAQRETMKNILLYEQELDEELNLNS